MGGKGLLTFTPRDYAPNILLRTNARMVAPLANKCLTDGLPGKDGTLLSTA